MKKFQILALGAVAALAVSCNGGGSISTNAKLNDSGDTLAYAYGIELAEKGLTQHLAQIGVLNDTAQVRQMYDFRIQGEADEAKKAELRKEVIAKIDSLTKANKKNLDAFFSGLNESINADKSKSAYYRGIEVGSQLSQMAENLSKQVYGEESDKVIDKKVLLAGVVASLKKEKPALENTAFIVESKMQELQEKQQLAEEERLKKENAAGIEAGQKFLAENKTKEGVVTLPSGLQYKIIKEGKGAIPTATDRVKVHYHGTLIDGTVFDSSVQRGEPVTFGVTQVIKGWTEALQLMPVGSKWMVYIPYELGYGSRPAGSIPPFSTLVFEVELLGIEK